MSNTAISEDRIERIVDYGTVLEGISIGGVNVSGMTGLEASEATQHIGEDLLASAKLYA